MFFYTCSSTFYMIGAMKIVPRYFTVATCKQAIPARTKGGKVIIIEMVRGSAQGDRKISEMEDIQNVFMLHINGVEQGINEWKRIFSDAGLSDDYKIMPVLAPYSE